MPVDYIHIVSISAITVIGGLIGFFVGGCLEMKRHKASNAARSE